MSSQAVDATLNAAQDVVVLDGCGMGVTDVVRLADGAARPVPGTEAMKRVQKSWDAARRIAATGRVPQPALALAHFRPAATQVARLSTSRAAAAALGDLRAFSAPASLGHAVLSRGVEEQAGFASLAAPGCELVAAVRALRRRGLRPGPELPVGRAPELAESVLDGDLADRPPTHDGTAAARLLDRFTDIWRGSTS